MSTELQQSFTISSEAIAWDALERIVDAGAEFGPIEFDGWPNVTMLIQGERYSASLPSGLMRQVSEIQSVVNRCYGRVAHEGDGRSVKHSERHEIELVYEIREGSTELRADATGLLNRLGDALAKPSTQKVAGVTVIVLALIITGGVVLNGALSNSTDVESKRLALLQRAIETAPQLKDATPEFQKVYRDIVAAASDADRITIGSTVISKADIGNIAARQKGAVQRVDLSGECRVKSIRRFAKHFLIEIELPDGENVRAQVPFDKFPEASLSAVSASIARNTTISLSITAMKHKDGFSNARVTSIGV